MAPSTCDHGVGAVVSALIRFIHPSEHIRRIFPNPVAGQRLSDCQTIRQEMKKVSRKDQLVLVVHHDDFKTEDGDFIDLYAVKRYWKVHKGGDEDLRFDVASTNDGGAQGEEMLPLPAAVDDYINGERVNVVEALQDVVEIDDDNEPAPENVPRNNDNNTGVFGEWGHTGFCHRRIQNMPNSPAKIIFNIDPTTDDIYLQLFEGLFPANFLDKMVTEINKKISGDPVTYGELLKWIGMWVLMSTVDGSDRRSFWSTRDIDIFEGAPFRLAAFMSRNRFENILNNLVYTSADPPAFRDPFWEVRWMLQCWNDNMAEKFIPSWINCVDESMSKWVNEYTCPGFMFVPRKPWPFGNEYHDACCAESDIIWSVDLREGKDRPRDLGAKEHDNNGKTVGTLLRLTRPIWGGGKVLVLDSGFCVLQAIVELKKKGVFAASLIKKRRYWPKYINGDAIIQHFQDKEVGTTDALPGVLDDVPVHVHCMKEPDYVMMLMSSYGTLSGCGEEKRRHFKVNGEKQEKTFKYPEVVHNHYKYRDCIDNHNSQRMHPLSMEETWMTTRWPNRVFCFLLALTMVNVQNAATYFAKTPKMDCLSVRRLIAKQLINNKYLRSQLTPKKRKRRGSIQHSLVMVPIYKKLFRGDWSAVRRNMESGSARIAVSL